MDGATGPLRRILDDAIIEHGGPMKDYTVLSPQVDPYRLDTQPNHRDGKWLADTAARLGLGDRLIHLRGLHYMVIKQPKPDGTLYSNTDADWLWLSGDAGKAARWLGYLPFDQIEDHRNAEPVVRIWSPAQPMPYLSVGLDVDIPDVDDIEPSIGVYDFRGTQPYKLVMVGEKSSLEPVLGPEADRCQADLYLPTGEISATLVYQIAKIGAADGRPMVILYFADCDPAGWQMPISVGRKLQAFKTLLFPDLVYEMHRVALTPDQVRTYDLPVTPLKESERRADKWRAAMGVEQTKIDALAALNPRLLARIARDAITPFYDRTLAERVREAKRAYSEQAQSIVDASVDADHLARIRAQADAKMGELRDEIDAINDALRIGVDDFDLPNPIVPTAQLNGSKPLPLLDSRWPWADQTQALIDSKAYRSGRDL
jgi:hypothetical protein